MSFLKVCVSQQSIAKGNSSFALQVNVELPNTVTAIFGESGAGKTSLLRVIAGLNKVKGAQISIGDEVWQDDHSFVATHDRQLAYVFQDAGLFPHLSVLANIDYAAKRSCSSKASGRENPEENRKELYELLNISRLLNRMPGNLSGGEKQRVAIARAMVQRPKLLLLDEPLSSLDQSRKNDVLPYLEALCAELNVPALYVSHSLDEVSRLADYMVVLKNGSVAAHGSLIDVVNDMTFSGESGHEVSVLINAVVEKVDQEWGLVHASIAGATLLLRDDLLQRNQRFRLRLYARDISISLSAHSDSSILNVVPAVVSSLSPDRNPASVMVRLKLSNEEQTGIAATKGESEIIAQLTRKSVAKLNLKEGQQVWAQVKSVAILR